MQADFLDQMLSTIPDMPDHYRDSSSIDVYASGAYQMDCNQCGVYGAGCHFRQHLLSPGLRRDVPMGDNIALSARSTPNTAILKETVVIPDVGSLVNIYSHHDNGPGREDLFHFKG